MQPTITFKWHQLHPMKERGKFQTPSHSGPDLKKKLVKNRETDSHQMSLSSQNPVRESLTYVMQKK